MNKNTFFEIIGKYNSNTLVFQLILIVLILMSLIFAYRYKKYFLPKVFLGISNIFVSIVFFMYYGKYPIQYYFAAPLFLISGSLFIYEAVKNKKDILNKPNSFNVILFIIVLLYPLISYLLGHEYPLTALFLMPCPLISLSIVIYSNYDKKNKLLMILLILWGMTGVKSIIFEAYEDIILWVCGFYGIYILIKDHNNKRALLVE